MTVIRLTRQHHGRIFKLQVPFFYQAVQVEKKEAEEEGGKDTTTHKEKGEEAALEKDEKDKEKEEEEEEKEKEREKEEEKEKKDECGPEEGSNVEKEVKTGEGEAKAPRAQRRPRTMQIKVTLLDDAVFECELEVR